MHTHAKTFVFSLIRNEAETLWLLYRHYKLGETETACTGPAVVCTTWDLRPKGEHIPGSLTQKLWLTDNHLIMKI